VRSASLTVIPVGLKNMYISPVSTSGGQSILVKAYLNGPAPAGGQQVRVTSSNPTVLPVPTIITIPAGALDAGVLARLNHVAGNTVVTVTGATSGSTSRGTLTAIPTQISAVGASVRALRSYGTSTLSFNLTGPAPAGGLTIYLSSSNAGVLAVPASVFVPAGARSAAVVARAGRASATVSVTINGRASGVTKGVALTVAP
jgi:hypothetical protein